ncbi:hypothetical protein GGR33_000912 [Methylobacterium brachythecii]|uniref:Uncharacterized protein n=1 Tax=Methylobacterium brachythecii TaxID=1176177 RepID=A0A7W6AI80_9HYPH|nr:hypothetical protein [Methylobacterium brachythecii]
MLAIVACCGVAHADPADAMPGDAERRLQAFPLNGSRPERFLSADGYERPAAAVIASTSSEIMPLA